MSGAEVALPGEDEPTADTLVGVTAVTPKNSLYVEPAASGANVTDQLVPLKCSTIACWTEPTVASPTAHTSLADVAVTAVSSQPLLPAGAGTAACVQFVPS